MNRSQTSHEVKTNIQHVETQDESILENLRNGKHLQKSLLLHLSRKCNLRCSHCYWLGHDNQYFSNEDMPPEKARGILDYFYQRGIKRVALVAEGEITLYPHLNEMIHYAYSLGFTFLSTFTNAILLDKILDLFAEHLNLLNFSLDGYDEMTYAKNRRSTRWTFRRILENIKALIDKRSEIGRDFEISLGCTVGRQNLYDIEPMIKMAEQLQVNRIEFFNYHLIKEYDEYWSPLLYDDPCVLDYLDRIKNRTDYTVDIVLPNLCGGKDQFWCGYTFEVISIGTVGAFSPCCAIPPDDSYGNYFQDPESFTRDALQTFRQQIVQAQIPDHLPKTCRRCPKLSMVVDIFFAKQRKWIRRISSPTEGYIWQELKGSA